VGCDHSSEKDMNICKREELGKNSPIEYRQRAFRLCSDPPQYGNPNREKLGKEKEKRL
jgi:hypothetical protein